MDFFTKLEQAFSVTYFQASTAYIRSNHSYEIPSKRWGIVDEGTSDLAHYMADASWVYELNYRNKSEEDVLVAAREYDIKSLFSKGQHISEYSKEMFIKLMDYLKQRGVKVEFYLCPLAPALWDRIQNEPDADQYYILDELEAFAV